MKIKRRLKACKTYQKIAALIICTLLFFFIGNYALNSVRKQNSHIIRSIEISSITFKTPKNELDIKMSDPAMNKMWGIHAIQAQKAWTKLNARGHRNVNVAIIDTGIDKNHPDLQKKPLGE